MDTRVHLDLEAEKAYRIAVEVAKQYKNAQLCTEHLLYGIMHTNSAAAKYIRNNNGDPDTLLEIFSGNPQTMYPFSEVELSSRLNTALINASQLAMRMGSSLVSPDHIALGIIRDPNSLAVGVLVEGFHINLVDFRQYLINALQREPRDINDDASVPSLPPELQDMGIDLTERARQHKLDPIIGRDEEIERAIEILCRKTKNNPVLIGEPGVGKSAIVEGLAQRIVNGDVPKQLRNKILYTLDIASLMAGTKYRGVLEEKLKNAIDTIKTNGNIVVFIDELHTIAQAGSKEGEVSPSDILKPYLARGELQTIGATTTDEYRKYIEKDKALERRFQPIMVDQPTVEQTIQIIKGLRENYENFHNVKLPDSAIDAAVKLSDRYITDRFFPDKAIDVIDEAMSRAKVKVSFDDDKIKYLTNELESLKQQCIRASARKDYEGASTYSAKCKELDEKLKAEKLKSAASSELAVPSINEEDVAAVIGKWTKIPVTRLTESESDRLIRLEDELHKRVIGQHKAIVGISKAIRRARTGLKSASRPIGSFMFLGPTGVGKTELCKALGEAMFDDENAVIRLDMSEYMESYSVSKLIGSAPGYVGYDEGGQLTERVRRRPYSVVLFDEIEKAHPDVFNILLQILDDGRLTDSHGRLVSFKNCIIIMTSNVGVSELKNKHVAVGFVADEKSKQENEKSDRESIVMDALKSKFRPEFLNRIDLICVFDNLSREDIAKIAQIMLTKLEATLKPRNMELKVTTAALDYLVDHGYDEEYGARPLRRVIEQQIEDRISDGILRGELHDNSVLKIDCVGGEIKVTEDAKKIPVAKA